MSYKVQSTEALTAVKLIAKKGFDELPSPLPALINESMCSSFCQSLQSEHPRRKRKLGLS